MRATRTDVGRLSIVALLLLHAFPVRAQNAPGAPPSPALQAALAEYRHNHLAAAESLFSVLVRREPRNDEALLWLAETIRRGDKQDSAASLARQVLARRPCSSWAHVVVADASNPQYVDSRRANSDTVWVHLRAAVRCDTTDGNAWLATVIEAASRHDYGAYTEALRRVVTTGFLTPATLAYSRWLLRQLPDSAMLITSGDLDTYPALALQVVEGLRPDVTVINSSLLNLAWYRHMLRDRQHVSFLGRDSVIDASPLWFQDSSRVYSLGDVVLMLWRRAEMSGTLDRRLVFALTVGDSTVKSGEGAFALAGGYYVPRHGADTSAVDTLRMRRSLATADGRALAGPVASPADRSPVRGLPSDGLWARTVMYPWFEYVNKLGETGRSADARASLHDLELFLDAAGVRDEESRRSIEQLRAWVRQLP